MHEPDSLPNDERMIGDRPEASRPRVTILTGATGFLGGEILECLLKRNPLERVLVTVRDSRAGSAKERLSELLGRMFEGEEARRDATERVSPIPVDLGHESVELDEALREMVIGRTCRVIHGAATVRLDHPIEVARNVNVGGTRRILSLAEKISEITSLESFAYIGTAFVAGTRSGVILEDELDVGQGFHNTYEQSKLEAEQLVRSCADRLPISIFRPSVIAGRATTGFTTGFKTIYWPLKTFRSGLVVCIPADPDAIYDLVPVDYVAEALLHILDRLDSIGGCYHLTAGQTITLDRAIRLAAEVFGVRRIPPFVSPRFFFPIIRPILYLTLWGKWREVMKKSKVLLPYLTCRLEFDNRSTITALEGSGLVLPDIETYLKAVYQYVKESDRG